MNSGYENRRFARSQVRVPVRLVFEGGQVVEAQTADLSPVGLRVLTVDTMPMGAVCVAALEDDLGALIHVRGTVVRREIQEMAIEIEEIEEASFEALRRLLVENADSPFAYDTQLMNNLLHMPRWY